MLGLLILLFTIIPALEIYLLIKIGGIIGGMNTLLIVIATGVVGAALAKGQGLTVLNSIQNKLAQGELPANQIIHGLLIFAGGLMLLAPGILTDILGLSMVFPGTRALWVHLFQRWFKNAAQTGNIQFGTFHTSSFYRESQHSKHSDPTLDENTFEASYEKKDP